jgi:superfamily II DNA or RNA helicase
MLIQRARIAKEAENKIPMAARVISENFQAGQRWLVYCDNQFQMRKVSVSLGAIGVGSAEYFSGMIGDKERTLRNFEVNGGVVVAIKCLDEGVDIPAVSHALILASSKNPREFIQRRGRVLRQSKGKHFAHIYDAITVPDALDTDFPAASIVASEIARGIEFAKSSENPSASTELERIATRFGLDTTTITKSGLEEDEDE